MVSHIQNEDNNWAKMNTHNEKLCVKVGEGDNGNASEVINKYGIFYEHAYVVYVSDCFFIIIHNFQENNKISK